MKCNVCKGDMFYKDGYYECEFCGNLQFASGQETGASAMKQIYAEAFQQMQDAEDYNDYMAALNLFQKIPSYEDSMKLAQVCMREAGRIKRESDRFLRMRIGIFRQKFLITAANLFVVLGILLPWYQKRGVCEYLFWEVEMVTDSMALTGGIHQVFGTRGYFWWVFFLLCMAGVSVTLGKKDFRKTAFFLAGLLLLTGMAWTAVPPVGYEKAGTGRFFMAAGLGGIAVEWMVIALGARKRRAG